MKLLVFLLVFVAACSVPQSADITVDVNVPEPQTTTAFHIIDTSDGTKLTYALLLPDEFSNDLTYPVLLAFPPGPQDREMVQIMMDQPWIQDLSNRDWIIMIPQSPNQLFFQASSKYIPELVEETKKFNPEGGKIHVAGISNGGISSFTTAISNPESIHSVTVLPGYPVTLDGLGKIIDIQVAMFAGEFDTSWVERMNETYTALNRIGGQVSFEVIPNEQHIMYSLATSSRLTELLESRR